MLKYVLCISQIGTLIIVFVLSLQSHTATAEETQLSDDFAMVMRPPEASIEIDESEAQDIANFFHKGISPAPHLDYNYSIVYTMSL